MFSFAASPDCRLIISLVTMGKQITLCSSSLAFVEGHDDTSVASVMWFFRCVNNALRKNYSPLS